MTYYVNFNSLLNSLLLQHLWIDKCEWNNVLDSFVHEWQGSSFFIGTMIFMALLLPGFLNLVFKATTTGICYTILGQLSLVNTDSNANLSPPHIELVHIQEELCKTKLRRKAVKITNKWSIFCLRVRNSKFWMISFYLIIFVAFGVNLTP